MFDRGRLQSGESLLIHGGSSGIGVAAIQMAKALRSKVYVTAGSDKKCRACLNLGADAAINYKTADFESEIHQITGGNGVDVILDMIGGDYTPRNLRILAMDGRLLLINVMQGNGGELDLSLVMRKRLTITGSTLRNRSVEFKSGIAASLYKNIWAMVASGVIKPVIYKAFEAHDAKAAHALMESSAHIGKIVLTF